MSSASREKETSGGEDRRRVVSAGELIRQADQSTVAVLVVVALAAIAAYWFVRGGHRGQLIEIDRAEPLEARFLVDVNEADWPELAQLPGIGEVLARRIVDSRTSAGPFADHDDLRRVNGIGPRTLEQIEPYLAPMPDRSDVATSGRGHSDRSL